jgi:hypothetical protein
MLRRTVDALAVLAFPVSVFMVGSLQPSPLEHGPTGPPRLLLDVAILAAGAVASLSLVVLSRRLAGRENGSDHAPSAVGWLLAGWPLPFPRRRDPELPVSGMPHAGPTVPT